MQAQRGGACAGAAPGGDGGSLLPRRADHVDGRAAGGHRRRLPALARIVVSGRRRRRRRRIGVVHWHYRRGGRIGDVHEQDGAAAGGAPVRGRLHAHVHGPRRRVRAEQGRHGIQDELAAAPDVHQIGVARKGAGGRVYDEQDGRRRREAPVGRRALDGGLVRGGGDEQGRRRAALRGRAAGRPAGPHVEYAHPGGHAVEYLQLYLGGDDGGAAVAAPRVDRVNGLAERGVRGRRGRVQHAAERRAGPRRPQAAKGGVVRGDRASGRVGGARAGRQGRRLRRGAHGRQRPRLDWRGDRPKGGKVVRVDHLAARGRVGGALAAAGKVRLYGGGCRGRGRAGPARGDGALDPAALPDQRHCAGAVHPERGRAGRARKDYPDGPVEHDGAVVPDLDNDAYGPAADHGPVGHGAGGDRECNDGVGRQPRDGRRPGRKHDRGGGGGASNRRSRAGGGGGPLHRDRKVPCGRERAVDLGQVDARRLARHVAQYSVRGEYDGGRAGGADGHRGGRNGDARRGAVGVAGGVD